LKGTIRQSITKINKPNLQAKDISTSVVAHNTSVIILISAVAHNTSIIILINRKMQYKPVAKTSIEAWLLNYLHLHEYIQSTLYRQPDLPK
jgi:hypothetical protein